ncbi:transposase family protein [Streptomyces sp. NPDC055287]
MSPRSTSRATSFTTTHAAGRKPVADRHPAWQPGTRPVPPGRPGPALVPRTRLRALPGARRRLPLPPRGHRHSPTKSRICTKHSAATCSSLPHPAAPRCGSPTSSPSTPDITAARIHALPALYRAAANGRPTLADKGYIGAGINILVPVRRPKGRSEQALHADTRTTNNLIRGVRALGERAAAELKPRWRTPRHICGDPLAHRTSHIGHRASGTGHRRLAAPVPQHRPDSPRHAASPGPARGTHRDHCGTTRATHPYARKHLR